MNPRVRQAELARQLDVKRQAINDLVTRGILHVGADGLIDIAEARAAIAANIHPGAKTATAVHTSTTNSPQDTPPDTAKPKVIDYHAARTLREYSEAQRAALKFRQEIGEMVDAASVTRAVTTWAATIRSALERIPDKLADRVAAEVDSVACHALMTAEIDLVLADLAAGARNLKMNADDGHG
jgi:hypothetical protein